MLNGVFDAIFGSNRGVEDTGSSGNLESAGDLAWNTGKSAHCPWRLSQSPGLGFALPAKYFAALGLARLFIKTT